MFETYKATENDFQAIEEGVKTVWRPEMNFVFKKKSLIEKVVVVSYDSEFLYLWTKLKFPRLETIPCRIQKYQAYKIPHKIKLKNVWQLGWRASLPIGVFEKLLPSKLQKSNFEIPKISGGLLTPFIKLQKKAKSIKKPNPYITYESYLATVVHEFGHVYYNQHKLWWYSDKKQNITYLEIAKKLFENKRVNLHQLKIEVPSPLLWSEVFAFCADYHATSLLWPKHKEDIDQMNLIIVKQAILKEKKKDLEKENSFFDEAKSLHLAAAIFGKIIIARYPHEWPQKLLQPFII